MSEVSFGAKRGLQPGDGVSGGSEELLWGGVGGAWTYSSFCNKGQVAGTPRLLLVKENQIAQAKECSTVLYLGGCASQGSLWWAPRLPGPGPVCSWPAPLGAHGERLHVGLDGRGSSPLGPLRAHQLLLEGWNHWGLWCSLFTDGRKYSTSQSKQTREKKLNPKQLVERNNKD